MGFCVWRFLFLVRNMSFSAHLENLAQAGSSCRGSRAGWLVMQGILLHRVSSQTISKGGGKAKQQKTHWNAEISMDWSLKLVEHRGIEPLTSWLPVMRAPSCANAPDPIPYIPFERKSSLPVYIRQTASGATGRDRTGHLHVTNVLLCQMSYSGMLKSIYWLTAWWYFTMLEKFRQYTTFIFCGDFLETVWHLSARRI